MPIEAAENVAFGDRDAVWYDQGEISPDSPYLCKPSERNDLEAESTCLVWSIDGWRFVSTPGDVGDFRRIYVEDLGVIIAQPATYEEGTAILQTPFDGIVVELIELTDG